MKFLEAHRLVQEMEGIPRAPLFLGMSGTGEPMALYLQAAGAELGLALEPEFAPFGTLRQTLAERPASSDDMRFERFLLLPWDLVPELDWRTGFPESVGPASHLWSEAHRFIDLMGEGRLRNGFYIPAPIPPIHPHPDETSQLANSLVGLLSDAGAAIWSPSRFSLGSYLASGAPLASPHLGPAARDIVATLVRSPDEPKKVLVTDLDGVLWHGVIGEDGLDAVECRPEGQGYRHFLYQSFLLKLRRQGVVLAVVSRNDADLVESAFRQLDLAVNGQDFVAIVPTYGAKSAQIRKLAENLNLGLDSFVFVDDNPIEIEEVEQAIPEITTLPFPTSDDALPGFLVKVAKLFGKHQVTPEDHQRTDLYRRRLEGLVPSNLEGADLSSFLKGLDMRLQVHDRRSGDRKRAVQLINKTNQFNLNGVRRHDTEVQSMLDEGGMLFGASLSDRAGHHGEILACLLDKEGRVRSWVLSCRVFQRRVEHAFLNWLRSRTGRIGPLEFQATKRNEPIRNFLTSLGASLPEEGGWIQLPEDAPDQARDLSDGLLTLEDPAPG